MSWSNKSLQCHKFRSRMGRKKSNDVLWCYSQLSKFIILYAFFLSPSPRRKQFRKTIKMSQFVMCRERKSSVNNLEGKLPGLSAKTRIISNSICSTEIYYHKYRILLRRKMWDGDKENGDKRLGTKHFLANILTTLEASSEHKKGFTYKGLLDVKICFA